MLARKLLIISKGKAFVVPTFTGSHTVFGDAKKGYIEIYDSGTLTFEGNSIIDVCLIGGGKKGSQASFATNGGTGGAGSAGQSYYKLTVNGDYAVVVGASEGNTSAFEHTQYAGGGAAGGAGAKNGSNGGDGSTGLAVPFEGDSPEFISTLGGGGGGGGFYTGNTSYPSGKGGSNGGGRGGSANSTQVTNGYPGAANTGGGGGGGGGSPQAAERGGSGGSGLVIVRWGY